MKHNYSEIEMKSTGIYKITCLVNNRFYIGSAACTRGNSNKVGFKGRLNQHILKLNKNQHHNCILQNSWNKYGSDNFIFEILEYCNIEKSRELEQKYLDELQPFYPKGFNICKTSLGNHNTLHKVRSYKRDTTELNNHLRISVDQYDLEGNFIKNHLGITQASRNTGISRVSIYKCCRGIYARGGNFIWKYTNPEFKTYNIKKFNIKLTNLITNEIIIYKTIKEVSKILDFCVSTLYIHIRENLILNNTYKIEKIFL